MLEMQRVYYTDVLLITFSLVTHHRRLKSCTEKNISQTIDCRLESILQQSMCNGDVKTHKGMKKGQHMEKPNTQTNKQTNNTADAVIFIQREILLVQTSQDINE